MKKTTFKKKRAIADGVCFEGVSALSVHVFSKAPEESEIIVLAKNKSDLEHFYQRYLDIEINHDWTKKVLLFGRENDVSCAVAL